MFQGIEGSIWILAGLAGLPWGLLLIAGLTVIRRAGREWDEITRRLPMETPCQGSHVRTGLQSGKAGGVPPIIAKAPVS